MSIETTSTVSLLRKEDYKNIFLCFVKINSLRQGLIFHVIFQCNPIAFENSVKSGHLTIPLSEQTGGDKVIADLKTIPAHLFIEHTRSHTDTYVCAHVCLCVCAIYCMASIIY